MTDKLIKFFKTLVLIQISVLALIAGFRYLTPNLYANVYKAYESNAPTNFIITVQNIYMVKEDGTEVSLWAGSEEVDLTSLVVGSLANIKTFNLSIPAGNYTLFKMTISNKYKVKGNVPIGSTTYHTKTAHSGWESGADELEELIIQGMTNSQQALTRGFDPVLKIGSSASAADIHVLVDFSYLLSFYDGSGTPPMPPNQAAKGMYLLNYLPYAITFGAPAKKEVYDYTASGETGKARITILYDANDNPVRGLSRPIFINSTGYGFNATGWLFSGNFGQTSNITKNADGTLKLVMLGAPTSSGGYGDITMPSFKRASDANGTFTSTRLNGGTYATTKVE